jgi:hypothetical protein
MFVVVDRYGSSSCDRVNVLLMSVITQFDGLMFT